MFAVELTAVQSVDGQKEQSFAFWWKFLPETYFLRIVEIPSLNIVETLLLFTGVLLMLFVLWLLQRPRVKKMSGCGFKLLNLGEQGLFIPLKSEIHSLDFLSQIKTNKKFRLSTNLNRVTLTPHQSTYLLEDKNYKNALLINRRRTHRTILCDNDVLDIGEMILLFRNPGIPAEKTTRTAGAKPQFSISGVKPRGPVQKITPVLIIAGTKQEIPLVRNLNSIGSSNFNDIIIASTEIASRHLKIYKVGESWKIQNLENQQTTSVNGRRIEQKFLQNGDEVSFGDISFKFVTNKSQNKKPRSIKKETVVKTIKT